MLPVDTNVLVDRLQDDAEWADWSIAQLRAEPRNTRKQITIYMATIRVPYKH